MNNQKVTIQLTVSEANNAASALIHQARQLAETTREFTPTLRAAADEVIRDLITAHKQCSSAVLGLIEVKE